jgi:hypothetical protein
VNEVDTLSEEFVTSFPQTPAPGVIYVSMPYASALHLCACGCGSRVVTPLSPDGWELRYRGNGVSLHPSIGNWRMPCESHYWVRGGRIVWIRDTPSASASDARADRGSWLRRAWQRVTGR